MKRAAVVSAITAMIVAGASCGPQTRTLAEGSKAPAGPRVASGERFEPRVGDFASVETFQVVPTRMSEAAATMVNVTLPRIRERGGLRDVWLLRNDTRSTLEIVSIWADPVDFQRWQMSSDRVAAYQPLGPTLAAQPTAEAVGIIGLIDARTR